MNEELLKNVGKRIGSLNDLPKELRDQLNVAKSDDLTDDIVDVIKEFDGIANIDEILVGLYKKDGKIQQRQFVANKLYRMTRAGFVQSVEGKRGVYKVT